VEKLDNGDVTAEEKIKADSINLEDFEDNGFAPQ
jgi:hypothetical protein